MTTISLFFYEKKLLIRNYLIHGVRDWSNSIKGGGEGGGGALWAGAFASVVERKQVATPSIRHKTEWLKPPLNEGWILHAPTATKHGTFCCIIRQNRIMYMNLWCNLHFRYCIFPNNTKASENNIVFSVCFCNLQLLFVNSTGNLTVNLAHLASGLASRGTVKMARKWL